MAKPATSSRSKTDQIKTKPSRTDHEKDNRPRSRFEPEPGGRLRLGERDRRLLADLYLHGVMLRHQLQALYFGSVPRCNARLRQLFDGGFVTRHFLPAAPFGSEAVYALGPAGIPVVAARLTADGQEADVAAIRQQCRQGLSPALLEHTLAIAEFRVALCQATAGSRPRLQAERKNNTRSENNIENQVEIERWLPELLCRHEYDIRRLSPGSGSPGSQDSGSLSAGSGARWHREIFKPDGFVRLRHNGSGRYLNYFLEIDRGHVSSEKFVGKLRSHRRYLESGLFDEIYGAGGFHTLVVTTSQKRLENLRALVEEADEGLFWLTTFEAVSTEGVLTPIWQVPGQAERASLI